MTIGSLVAIIFGIICILVGIGLCIYYFYEDEVGFGITSLIIGLVVGAICIGGACFYLNTESGKRAIKDMKSELGGGINRIVSVYDVGGELIQQYTGKFDIETGNASGAPYIVFDDENGKRHIVYYTTGTILIDEK